MIQGCYLLHCERPLSGRASHYIGWSSDMRLRIQAHMRGNGGAKIVEAYARNDIRFVVVRLWPGGDRDLERTLHNRKNSPKLCPVCQGRVPVGWSIDIKRALFERARPHLATHQGKRRPM